MITPDKDAGALIQSILTAVKGLQDSPYRDRFVAELVKLDAQAWEIFDATTDAEAEDLDGAVRKSFGPSFRESGLPRGRRS